MSPSGGTSPALSIGSWMYNTFTVLGSKISVTWMYEGYDGPSVIGTAGNLLKTVGNADSQPALTPMVCGIHKGLETLAAGTGRRRAPRIGCAKERARRAANLLPFPSRQREPLCEQPPSHRAGLHRVAGGVGAARDAQPRRPRLVRGRVQPRQAVRRRDPRGLSESSRPPDHR